MWLVRGPFDEIINNISICIFLYECTKWRGDRHRITKYFFNSDLQPLQPLKWKLLCEQKVKQIIWSALLRIHKNNEQLGYFLPQLLLNILFVIIIICFFFNAFQNSGTFILFYCEMAFEKASIQMVN